MCVTTLGRLSEGSWLNVSWSGCTFLSIWGRISPELYLRIQSVLQRKQHLTVTKINLLTLFKEIIAVYAERDTKHINIKSDFNMCLITKQMLYVIAIRVYRVNKLATDFTIARVAWTREVRLWYYSGCARIAFTVSLTQLIPIQRLIIDCVCKIWNTFLARISFNTPTAIYEIFGRSLWTGYRPIARRLHTHETENKLRNERIT